MKMTQNLKNSLLASMLLGFIFFLGCDGNSQPEHLVISLEHHDFPAIQYANASRMSESVKDWRLMNPNASYTESVVDSLAEASIHIEYGYHLPSEKKYFIYYVNDSFFEVLFLPERYDRSVNEPYYLLTADSLYTLVMGQSIW